MPREVLANARNTLILGSCQPSLHLLRIFYRLEMSTLTLPVSFVEALAIGKESRTAAISLLFYDHIINLDREIHLVWMQDKKQPACWLYIFTRFFALAYYIFDAIPITPAGGTGTKICAIYLMCDGIVTMLSTLIVQVILQLRIYALYERSRSVLIFLLVLCALEIVVMAVLVGVTMSHLERVPILSTANGCAYQGLLKASSLIWIPGLIFEPILFLLVAYKAWGSNKRYPTIPIVRQIARDSLFYFVAVFAELLASAVVWLHAPQYINIFNPWSAALPSLLGCRLMLNMREAVYSQDKPNTYILESFSSASPEHSYLTESRAIWDTDADIIQD